MKFLTHPNIVIFISGDYCVFHETLTIEFLKKSGLIEKSLLNVKYLNYVDKSALISKQELSREYLKKVMPTAYRYKMPIMNDDQKINYKYYEDSKDLLSKMNIKELVEYNFNGYGKLKWSNLFLDILDSKPRGLINVYVYLYRMAKKIQIEESKIENQETINIRKAVWNLVEIKRFIDVLISSNDFLAENEESINRVIYLIQTQEESKEKIILNYDYLFSLYETFLKGKNTNKNLVLEKIININILGIFIEKIIISIGNTNKQLGIIYTDKILRNPISKFINMFELNKSIRNKLIEETDELDFILNFYHKLKVEIRANYVNSNKKNKNKNDE
ncbi:hypothetical protein [Oceanirhabdus sp. W0125-5]|uniref:hypothetical protein n=1 Tax=Oceanirhabdus sp. W0125-5 TaxID=2999116 RepID=UPI0022F2FBF1|nr:hypothetical protein [Oceanirhabdus sp. W0125-5]WBW98998.1 hypothetical protein OW730_09700 [Oceanirhabdus sp. W0125-5]